MVLRTRHRRRAIASVAATSTSSGTRCAAPAADSARTVSVTTSTCTAVTLYSGQFVAQSEFSVVTTLAPVTGWWNVV